MTTRQASIRAMPVCGIYQVKIDDHQIILLPLEDGSIKIALWRIEGTLSPGERAEVKMPDGSVKILTPAARRSPSGVRSSTPKSVVQKAIEASTLSGGAVQTLTVQDVDGFRLFSHLLINMGHDCSTRTTITGDLVHESWAPGWRVRILAPALARKGRSA